MGSKNLMSKRKGACLCGVLGIVLALFLALPSSAGADPQKAQSLGGELGGAVASGTVNSNETRDGAYGDESSQVLSNESVARADASDNEGKAQIQDDAKASWDTSSPTDADTDASPNASVSDDTSTEVDESAGAESSKSDGSALPALVLSEGKKRSDTAALVVKALSKAFAENGTKVLSRDVALDNAAFQRATETALWASATRPCGGTLTSLLEAEVGPVAEFRFQGTGLNPTSIAESVAKTDLSSYNAMGVGCWEQKGEKFCVVALAFVPTPKVVSATTTSEPCAPRVELDLTGQTSPLLLGRLLVDGYKTNLCLAEGTTRRVSFSWVQAPADEAALTSASDLPQIAIDPSSFSWQSSNEAAATVSPQGVLTVKSQSFHTNVRSEEKGADITVSLGDVGSVLRFHVSGAVPLYRLYNGSSGEHLFTSDYNEYQVLSRSGWSQEGVAWQGPWSSMSSGSYTATPIYRLYNPSNGDHHFTVSSNEYNALGRVGWRKEGITAFSADAVDGVPIYRLFNSSMKGAGSHLWTSSAKENTVAGNAGWIQEGIGFYGSPR